MKLISGLPIRIALVHTNPNVRVSYHLRSSHAPPPPWGPLSHKLIAFQNWMVSLHDEDTMCSGFRTWENPAETELEAPSLLASPHGATKSSADCWGKNYH